MEIALPQVNTADKRRIRFEERIDQGASERVEKSNQSARAVVGLSGDNLWNIGDLAEDQMHRRVDVAAGVGVELRPQIPQSVVDTNLRTAAGPNTNDDLGQSIAVGIAGRQRNEVVDGRRKGCELVQKLSRLSIKFLDEGGSA